MLASWTISTEGVEEVSIPVSLGEGVSWIISAEGVSSFCVRR